MTQQDTNEPAPAASPTSLQWLFILLGLGALAITQPLFADLGDAPELFIFYGTTTADLWILAALAVFLVPVTLWGIGWVIGRIRPSLGQLFYRSAATVLSAALGVQVARVLGVDRAVLLAGAGLAAGVVAWFALVRVRFIREWAMVLAPAGLIFAFLFLFTSAPARAVSGAAGSEDPIEPAAVAEEVAPLAILVLDEFPTRSMLTDDMQLDPDLTPNLAAFAGESTWFRGHTTNAVWTTEAVPSLVTGRYPESAEENALWFDHPDNLFRVLASTHQLQVDEVLTQLCPPTICSISDRSGDGSRPEPDPAWRRLTGDARTVVSQRIWPWSEPESIGLNQFADTGGSVAVFEGDGAVDVIDPVAQFFGMIPATQPARFADFLDAMDPGTAERPGAFFFHLVLPHQPWTFRADGSDRGEVDKSYLGFGGEESVADEPYAVAVGRDLHLDQVTYTDGLIGSFLNRLDEIGIYDDTTVVILADHGVSFVPGTNEREIGPANAAEVLPTPLFVKYPGQSEGKVVDGTVEIIDVLPMVEEGVGVTVPWEYDGVPVGERGDELRYFDDDEGMQTLDHPELMAHLQASAAFDQSPERVLADNNLTVDEAVVVADADPIEVEVPLRDHLTAIAPDEVVALGLVVGEDLVAVGMAATSGKVVVPVPQEFWGTSPPGVRLVPVAPGSGD